MKVFRNLMTLSLDEVRKNEINIHSMWLLWAEDVFEDVPFVCGIHPFAPQATFKQQRLIDFGGFDEA